MKTATATTPFISSNLAPPHQTPNKHIHRLDVYEESEADLLSERNNNDMYRVSKSRSPDYSYNERKGSWGDRKLSSGYFCF